MRSLGACNCALLEPVCVFHAKITANTGTGAVSLAELGPAQRATCGASALKHRRMTTTSRFELNRVTSEEEAHCAAGVVGNFNHIHESVC